MCSVFIYQLGRGCRDGLQVKTSQQIIFPCEILWELGSMGDYLPLNILVIVVNYPSVCGCDPPMATFP